MGFRISVACGVAMLLAGASAAFATSLSGEPVKLLSGADTAFAVSAFRNDGGFGAVVAKSAPDRTMDVHLQLYGAKGKPKGRKTAVINRFPPPDQTAAAGALPLGDGKTFVGYASVRFSIDGIENRFYGQFVSDGAPPGQAVDLAPTARYDLFFAHLVQLSGGRGLAYWAAGTDPEDAQAGARLVSPTGEAAPRIIDLTRKKSQLAHAYPFGDGFLTQHVRFEDDDRTGSVFVRIYDAAGEQKGAEVVLANKVAFDEAVGTSAMGLLNGDIVVFRSLKAKGGFTLSAQIHDGALKPKGKPKALSRAAVAQGFAAQPLPGGDFIVGLKVKDGENGRALEYSRFGPDLRQIGASARISGVAKPEFAQIVGLNGGNIVAIYSSNGSTYFGQVIKP